MDTEIVITTNLKAKKRIKNVQNILAWEVRAEANKNRNGTL